MKPRLNGAAVHHDTTGEGPDPVPTFWRMRAPTGRLLTCGLYQTADGLELRAGFEGDDPMWSEVVASEEMGLQLAAAWKDVVISKGGFVDLETLH
jgi:hypothetical protein